NEQRENVTVPLGVFDAWLPTTVAVSCTAVPGVTKPVLDGVVVIVALHWAKLPRTKSFSVAVADVDERVSDRKLAKHSLAIEADRLDRLTPPSNSSPFRKVWLPLLSVNVHGAIVPLVAFTIPQKGSFAARPTSFFSLR